MPAPTPAGPGALTPSSSCGSGKTSWAAGAVARRSCRRRISAMRGLPPRLHLPYEQLPAEDRRLWAAAMDSNHDDPFCDAPGARLADATRRKYMFGWRRYLGFLAISEPVALEAGAA